MPITLDLTSTTVADVFVQPSPLLEFMAAMHVLTEVDHHPDQRDRAALLRSQLGEDLMIEVHYYAPLWARYRSRMFFARGRENGTLEQQLLELRMMAEAQFTELAAEGALGMGRSADHVALLADGAGLVEMCRRRSSARADLAEALIVDPSAFRLKLLDFITHAWEVGVRDLWLESAPAMAAVAERIARQLQQGIVETIASLSPTASVIGSSQRVRFDKLDTLNFTAGRAPVVLVPSRLHSPHLTIKRAPGGELTILFPGSSAQHELSFEELRQRLQSFSSPLRIGILRHLLGEPLTSSELSLRLGIEATQVSRALSTLRASGLVISLRRDGVIRHHTDIDTIRRLGLDVLATIMR